MACLRLGVSAKVTVLVSRLHPKNLISKAYVNHTKADKVEGLVVVSEGPKLIRHEEKLVVIFCHPQKTNRRKSLIVGQSTALPMSLKREKNQDFSPHPTVVVAIMVHHWGPHNQTPTLSQLLRTQHKQQHKQQMGHKATTMFHWRSWRCWSPTYQGLTLTMQPSSATWCLGWLTTTINHCLRTSLCQWMKHQMPHNSSQIGSTPATATAALKEEGGTRHASVSTQR